MLVSRLQIRAKSFGRAQALGEKLHVIVQAYVRCPEVTDLSLGFTERLRQFLDILGQRGVLRFLFGELLG